MLAMSFAIQGHTIFGPLKTHERIIGAVSALLMIFPQTIIVAIGAGILILLAVKKPVVEAVK